MKRHGTWIGGGAIVLAVVTCSFAPARSADGVDARRNEAKTLYAQARYAEARPLLEQLAADGQATGPLLYRLAYCQRTAGQAAAAAATERSAVESLERELSVTDDIEVPFYLVNAYQNSGRDEDAKRVAAESAERIEQGHLRRPSDGDGLFQTGKLYADAGTDDKAAEWYAKAVEALTAEGQGSGSYVRRASRFLAERAFRLKDYDAAQRHYTTLTGAGEGGGAEFDRLAVSRARSGLYEGAAEAWRQAGRLGGANADRSRYCARLSTMAAQLGSLPASSPDDRAWTALPQEALESLMTERAGQVRQIQQEAQAVEKLTQEKRLAYREQLREHRAVLVAAALEYALRGQSIRQAAFFGGYAPLILKQSAWRVAPREENDAEQGEEKKRGKRKKGKKKKEG